MRRPLAAIAFAITFVFVLWFGRLIWHTLFNHTFPYSDSYTFPHDALSTAIQPKPLNASNCTFSEDDIRLVECDDLPKFAHSLPPYLISFQGSGNTFTRLVLELITGFYTGSAMANDRTLTRAGFKGDIYCTDQIIVVKSHV